MDTWSFTMTVSPLKKALLPSLLISGAIFSSLTLPLAVFGAQPLVIQLQEEPIFVGKLKDIAAPYVGLATLLSAGAGIASLTMGAWQQSSRKADKLEEHLSNLQQQLQETEGQLETLKLSETRLRATGLGEFLDEVEVAGQAIAAVEQTVVQAATTHSATSVHPMHVAQIEDQLTGLRRQLQEKEAQLAALEELQLARTIANQSASVSKVAEVNAVDTTSSLVANSVVSSPALVQPTQKKSVPDNQIVAANTALHALAQVSELQNRLEQIVSQVGTLQDVLQSELKPVANESQAVDDSYAALHHLNQRIQKLESLWSTQAMAS
jgi:chromosome segregation ATPase